VGESHSPCVETAAIAEDLMSHPVVTISPEAAMHEAVSLMREKNINSLACRKKQ